MRHGHKNAKFLVEFKTNKKKLKNWNKSYQMNV